MLTTAQVLLPRYVPRAGRETLLHLGFWARCEKLRSSDPQPSVTVAFLDLHKNYEQIGIETLVLTRDWQVCRGFCLHGACTACARYGHGTGTAQAWHVRKAVKIGARARARVADALRGG